MSSRIRTTLALITSTLVTTPLLAHPGHGTTDPQSVTHYVGEPVHALPLVLIVVAVAALSLLSFRQRKFAKQTH
ncbi:MAG: hypothetical protein R3B91_14635 [Planctomycetaceae bacterium]|nr:hypothetical protein [Planctomycetaceae bacterium]